MALLTKKRVVLPEIYGLPSTPLSMQKEKELFSGENGDSYFPLPLSLPRARMKDKNLTEIANTSLLCCKY